MGRWLFNVSALAGLLLWIAAGVAAIYALLLYHSPDIIYGGFYLNPDLLMRYVIGPAVWIALLLLFAMPFVWLRSYIKEQGRRRRVASGHCPACGYDLTGNASGVCPECGVAIPAKS